jgi:hypothetical protein
MKTKLLLLGLVIALVAFQAAAQYGAEVNINKQISHYYTKVATAKSYAASQSDTSTVYNVGGTKLCELYQSYADSVNVIVLVQKRVTPGSSWAFACGDTLDQTGTGGGSAIVSPVYRRLIIRDLSTDKLGGVGTQIRIVTNFQATLCGVTTPTYTMQLKWKP